MNTRNEFNIFYWLYSYKNEFNLIASDIDLERAQKQDKE